MYLESTRTYLGKMGSHSYLFLWGHVPFSKVLWRVQVHLQVPTTTGRVCKWRVIGQGGGMWWVFVSRCGYRRRSGFGLRSHKWSAPCRVIHLMHSLAVGLVSSPGHLRAQPSKKREKYLGPTKRPSLQKPGQRKSEKDTFNPTSDGLQPSSSEFGPSHLHTTP